jgi:LDH2 family malate/lactate/ureidoglycolate dehydrogenase
MFGNFQPTGKRAALWGASHLPGRLIGRIYTGCALALLAHIMMVSSNRLVELGERICLAHGLSARDAQLLTDTLVTAELWGHGSHGLLRLSWYMARVRSGAINCEAVPEIVSDRNALIQLDGKDALGQRVALEAIDLAVDRARRFGVGAVAVRFSNHFGTAAYFTRRAARGGCAALLFSNASPAMAPWGGRDKRVGNNPWSIAVPGGELGEVVLDIANTAVARGKIYLAAERGEPIPDHWALDRAGRPTTRPEEAIAGLLQPIAGHKGYAIALMIDMLAGVLTGSAFGSSVVGPYKPEGRSGAGHLAIAIDVEQLMPMQTFVHRVGELVAEIRSSARADGSIGIFFPGEIEAIGRARREREGIDLPGSTWQNLRELARSVGVDAGTDEG